MGFPIFRTPVRVSRFLFLCVRCSSISVVLRKIDRFLFWFIGFPIFGDPSISRWRKRVRFLVFLMELRCLDFGFLFVYVSSFLACLRACFCVRPASTKTSPTGWKRENSPKKMCTPPRSKLAPTSSFPASQVRDVLTISYFTITSGAWYFSSRGVAPIVFGVSSLDCSIGALLSHLKTGKKVKQRCVS